MKGQGVSGIIGQSGKTSKTVAGVSTPSKVHKAPVVKAGGKPKRKGKGKP